MIAVISDDFTGAAESGGVAHRYGLSAEIQIELNLKTSADVISIDMDTRSDTAEKAAFRVASLFRRFQNSPIEWVYKKVDSVLRGQVLPEMDAMLKTSGLPRVLLVPANPALGRIIRNGHYFINEKPIHRTDLGKDPEYPARSSEVLKMLGPRLCSAVYVSRHDEILPPHGIIVGEAATETDLTAWTRRLDSGTIPAGSAPFLAKILEARVDPASKRQAPPTEFEVSSTMLFICGSASAYSRSTSKEGTKRGFSIVPMPRGLFVTQASSSRLIQEWVNATVTALQDRSRVMVTIEQPLLHEPDLSRRLSHHLARLVKQVLSRQSVDHLYVEGGATASAVARHLGWKQMRVVRELAAGVVSMKVQGQGRPLLTTKPGSYRWPDKVWSG